MSTRLKSDRQIRRAQERKDKKEAAKLEKTATLATPSEKTMAANKANAQLSTGPRTAEGLRIASLNAVKTGLTGRTVLLPSDEAEHYEAHVARFFADHSPQEGREAELVQSMADSQWRMNRIPGLEMAIFAKGRREFAAQFEDEAPATAGALMDAETIIAYNRQLTNLSRQEGRLGRQYAKDLAELQTLQNARAQSEAERMSEPRLKPRGPRTSKNGFELSAEELSLPEMSLDHVETMKRYLGLPGLSFSEAA